MMQGIHFANPLAVAGMALSGLLSAVIFLWASRRRRAQGESYLAQLWDQPTSRRVGILQGAGWFAVAFLVLVALPASVGEALTDTPAVWLYGAESDDSGIAESLTVAYWLGAMCLAMVATVQDRGVLRFAWALAAIATFVAAGEELSWGQWLFQWQTPEGWSAINKQHETNLHNLAAPSTSETYYAFAGWVLLVGASILTLAPNKWSTPTLDRVCWPFRQDALSLILALLAAPLLQLHRFQEAAELGVAAFAFAYLAAQLSALATRRARNASVTLPDAHVVDRPFQRRSEDRPC